MMVKYLLNIGVIIPDDYNITPGSKKYDEYLAVAYTSALKQSLSSDDPIQIYLRDPGLIHLTM
jgi:hypothetical protein